MKNTFILIFLISNNYSFSQVTAHAGNDTTVCETWYGITQLQLGASNAATGGAPPYTYVWETYYDLVFGSTTYTLTASDFLDDTTVANPSIINVEDNPVEFVLTVTDSNGLTNKDTVIVSSSRFDTHLIEWTHNMLVGDSVKFVSLPNVAGGTQPLTYLWRPNHGLVDSTVYTNFWIKPTESTSYYLTVTDAEGCVATGPPVFHVYVGYLGIEDVINSKDEVITIYPNPSNGHIYFNTGSLKIQTVSIYDINNHLMIKKSLTDDTIDLTLYPKGIYLMRIETERGVVTKKISLQ